MIGKLRPRDCYSINYSIRWSREWTRQRGTSRPLEDLWTESQDRSLNHRREQCQLLNGYVPSSTTVRFIARC